jgi:hypothetical protein
MLHNNAFTVQDMLFHVPDDVGSSLIKHRTVAVQLPCIQYNFGQNLPPQTQDRAMHKCDNIIKTNLRKTECKNVKCSKMAKNRV